jgi:hypothetical protein
VYAVELFPLFVNGVGRGKLVGWIFTFYVTLREKQSRINCFLSPTPEHYFVFATATPFISFGLQFIGTCHGIKQRNMA